MDREQDIKIAEWLGYEIEQMTIARHRPYWMATPQNKLEADADNSDPFVTLLPCYSTDDADAISLLPELVKRGYSVILSGHPLETGWIIEITDGAGIDFCRHKSTIVDAICTGVVQLIESI